jgi:hypothetical protein
LVLPGLGLQGRRGHDWLEAVQSELLT